MEEKGRMADGLNMVTNILSKANLLVGVLAVRWRLFFFGQKERLSELN